MDRSEASALADLQMHWDEAYVITLDGEIWSARYRKSADELRAHTSGELRELIRSDYAYRQKADLVAYDPDDDYDDGRDSASETASEDDVDAGDGGTVAEADRMHQKDAGSAGRSAGEIGNFAAIRGERMSI